MVLAVAALMAAMMVSAGPAAMAQGSFGNETNFSNGWDVVQYNDDYYFVFDDAWDDCYWDDCYWDDAWGSYDAWDDCYWWDGEYWCEADF